jgi:fatty acid desaturase
MTAEDDAVRDALDYLQRESHQLGNAGRVLLARIEQTVLFAVAALSVATVVALADEHWALALALPWLGVLLWAMILAAVNEAFVLAAARSILEDQMEHLLLRVRPVIRMVGWERGGAKLALRSTSRLFAMAVALAMGLAAFVLCFVFTWWKAPSWRSGIVIEAIVFLDVLALAGFATWKVSHAYESARASMRRMADLAPDLPAAGRPRSR